MHRPRTWDAVVTVHAPGLIGDEATVVALADGLIVVQEGEPGPRVAAALADVRLRTPYRARLVHREDDVWAVGVRSIRVVELVPDPGGSELEVTWDGSERTVRVDGTPRLVPLPELGPVHHGRVAPYAATLRRLHGASWEIEIATL